MPDISQKSTTSSTDDCSAVHDPEIQLEKNQLRVVSNNETPLEYDFPEGSLRGWMVLIGSTISQFCAFGYTNAFGVYNDFYVRQYLKEKYTSSQISWIGSVQVLIAMSLGLFTGKAFDAGYFYHMAIGGTFALSFSLFMLSLTRPESYYQVFLAQGLLSSIGIGLLYVPSLAIVSQYFKRHRAFAMGISSIGGALGGAIHPIMLNTLFHGRVGFHNGVRISAGFLLGLMIISIALTKPRPPQMKTYKSSLWKDFCRFLCEPAYVLTTLGTFFTMISYYFPIFFLQLFAITQGIDPKLAFYTLTILNGASILGRIVPALVVNRYGVFNTMTLCLTGCTLLIFCDLGVKNATGIVLFAIAYGFFTGAFSGLLGPMVAALAKNDAEIGARMGICFTFSGIGGLLGNPIAGAFLSSSFEWWKPIVFAGMASAAGAALTLAARFLLVKQRGTQFV
ncbi:hypothetical protein AMATHDRAFT_68353 [Amanita thiersii Skay4041]|uniref:Major facilitator superfamily (MFS) profile domain-containing protein n=1 Tax=Amanita thiersii Skay4041 TaxID=703135 RepID=A0A2A9NHF3_9AGAR|nr:hypothetical protein AMATHDRAFT_68353 [Amanita thiersii Skay4041]